MLILTLLGNLITFPMALQFKHVPLYLEWAPLGVFSGEAKEKDLQEAKKDEQTGEDKVRFVRNKIALAMLLSRFYW